MGGHEINCSDGDPCTNDWCIEATAECGHEHVYPPPSSGLACSNQGCQVSIDVPEVLLVNNDDDNGNGVADCTEDGPIAEEDDLVLVPLSVSGCGQPGCLEPDGWSIRGEESSAMAFYADAQKGAPPDPALPPPGQVYLEGVAVADCDVPASFRISGWDPPWPDRLPCCEAHSARMWVVKVGTLDWQVAATGNPDLETCPNNAGRRIFPGKTSPDDPIPQVRNRVKLVATIYPPIGDVPVYFRVWDVDDPFDQHHADMPNVNLIDNDEIGGDNRPSPEAPRSYSANTDENGRAVVTVEVSMQPGNNYRAGASCLADAISQANQQTADALNANGGYWSGYSVPLVWSPMLTVWRKLHVETDSMARPTFGENTVTGQWVSAQQNHS